MKTAFFSLLAAGAALLVLPPAMAETAATAEGAASIQQIYEAGRCIVDRDRRAAVGILRAVPYDSLTADLSALPEPLARRCVRDLASPSATHLRGAIAQALFFRDFGGFGIEPARSIPLVDLGIPVQDSAEGSRRTDLYRWADCLVRNDAAHAERLMQSRLGSASEATAIDALRPFMAACAPAGAQMAVQPTELRSIIAQSAYHSMYRYWTRQLSPVRDQ